MESKTITLERESLYEKVWSTPMSKLGPKYGLSDNGLRKICKKLNIPTPVAGHWAKLHNSKKVTKTPLPEIQEGQSTTHVLTAGYKEPSQDEELLKNIPAKFIPKEKIPIRKTINLKNPLINATYNALKHKNIDSYGRLMPHSINLEGILGIRVSASGLKRALLIMDAIIKWFKNLNITVQIGKDERKTFIKWKEVEIKFFIVEEVKRYDYILSEKEKQEKQRMPFYPFPKWQYEATGNLRIEIDEWVASGIRKTWKDTNSRRIEDCLNDFIINIFKASLLKHQDRLKYEENERIRLQQRQREYEEELRRQEVQRQYKELEEMAISWNKRKLILKFIEDVRDQARKNLTDPTHIQKTDKWIRWAENYTMKIDPIKSLLENIQAIRDY